VRYKRVQASHGSTKIETYDLIRKAGTQETGIDRWTGQNQQNGQNETNVVKLARLQPCSALPIAPLTFYLGNPFPRLKLARLPPSLIATLATLPSISEIPFLDSENSVHPVENPP
jgi:hypothetical protein